MNWPPPPGDEPIVPVRPSDEWLEGFDPVGAVPTAEPASIPDAVPASSAGVPDAIPASTSGEIPLGGSVTSSGEIPLAAPASVGDSLSIPLAAPVSGVNLAAAPADEARGPEESGVNYGAPAPPPPSPAPGSDTEVLPPPPPAQPPAGDAKGMAEPDPSPEEGPPAEPDAVPLRPLPGFGWGTFEPSPAAEPAAVPVRPPRDGDGGLFETPLETLLAAARRPPFADPFAPPPDPNEPRPAPDPAAPVRWGPFALVGVVYAMMVSSSLVLLIAALVQSKRFEALTGPEERRARIVDMAAVEGVDAALVFVACLAIASPPRGPKPRRRLETWVMAVPIFAVLLGANFAFHLTLRSLIRDVPKGDLGIGWADGWVAILLICVQPAVIEELLFRHLMLGHMRPLVGTHLAVWVTGVLFAMAHVGAWVSVPILGLLGVGLGYARVYSGGLALPVLLHFLHNLLVTYANHAIGP